MEATVTDASAATQKPAAQPTMGGSVYVKPQDIAWEPTQFEGISIKVLYEDKPKGEMTCLLKWGRVRPCPCTSIRRSSRPASSWAHSTIMTASAERANSSGDGTGRSTRPAPTKAQ